MNTYVYFYFMNNGKSEQIRLHAESHTIYWKNKNLEDYKGGPFTDRSGGLIQFKINSLEEAEKLVEKDPFVVNNLVDKKWIKEWIIIA